MTIPTAKQVREAAVRKAITDLFPSLTEKQLAFFNKCHDNAPWKGFANCPDDQLNTSYELLRRTLDASVWKVLP